MKAFFAALLLLVAPVVSFAQAPSLMSYQGRVSDSAGTLIGATAPTNRTVLFKFYTASTAGTPVYVESQVVTISAGEFSVLLGAGTGVSGFHGPSSPATQPYITLPSVMTGPIYLGVTIDDGTAAVDTEITPRQQIVSAAYAFRAKVAEGLIDSSLSTTMLANSSVTADKIGSNSVITAKIADANITTAKIADGNISTAKIADAGVTTAKVADGSITTAKHADASITTAKIANDAVTSAQIANGTVTSSDIADNTIVTADLADNAVTNAKILNATISNEKLIAAIQQALCPPGTISAFAGDTAPAGWVLCDGSAISRSTYSGLWAVVGTRFGQGDNSSTFNVPDFRGRFLRGRDGNTGRDPDRASRTAMNTGGAIADSVGSIQGDMFRSHRHSVPNDGAGGGVDQNSLTSTSSNDEQHSYTPGTGYEGGNETRPLNANVNYIIKL